MNRTKEVEFLRQINDGATASLDQIRSGEFGPAYLDAVASDLKRLIATVTARLRDHEQVRPNADEHADPASDSLEVSVADCLSKAEPDHGAALLTDQQSTQTKPGTSPP